MKRYIFTAIATLLASIAPAQARSHVNINEFSEMAPYVYPANIARGVSRPDFTADGLSCLKLSDDHKRVVSYNLVTGAEVETLLDVTHTRENTIGKIDSYTLSPDGTKLLVATGTTPIYRRSTSATYYIYELRTRILTPLSETHQSQRSPVFSPDGRMVAFVSPADNNIYLKKLDYGTEVAVTTDGAINSIINGVPDWVYEEEFSTSCSMAWSNDNATLCYLKYDESRVPVYSFKLYEGTCQPMTQYALYPGNFNYKYPVAGEPNSVVTVHAYNVETRRNSELEIPRRDLEYIPRISFGQDPSGRLLVTTLDRAQSSMEIFAVNPRSGVAKSLFTEKSDAWLETCTYENITYLPNGFMILSARSGFTHAYLYSYEGQPVSALTSGNWDVKDYYGTDPKGNSYFLTNISGSINSVLVRVDAKGNITRLTPDNGTASAWFTPSLDHYAVNYSNSTTPPVVTLYASRGDKKVRVMESNEGLAEKYASAPKPEFTTITTVDGVTMNAYLILPPKANGRCPAIITQYSGPGSQEVVDRWKVDWTQYAALKGYVVLCVDPRGTGGKGRQWETVTYRNLGHYESIDLRGAARWLAGQSFVDPSRIGITGWSYGGYETLMAISADDGEANPFACAVAIAPVTSWRYYDTVYSERYMLTPGENTLGYDESSPMSHAKAMDIPLLLMHGTADDNVHLMNTLQYVSVIQSEGRFCDMFLYPNMNHSIYGCGARLNVYSRMLDYFDKNM